MAVNPIKSLAGQTAVYGMGTIVPRLLNYMLVPFYTRVFAENIYGQLTELYAYVAFFYWFCLPTAWKQHFSDLRKSTTPNLFSIQPFLRLSLPLHFLLFYYSFL